MYFSKEKHSYSSPVNILYVRLLQVLYIINENHNVHSLGIFFNDFHLYNQWHYYPSILFSLTSVFCPALILSTHASVMSHWPSPSLSVIQSPSGTCSTASWHLGKGVASVISATDWSDSFSFPISDTKLSSPSMLALSRTRTRHRDPNLGQSLDEHARRYKETLSEIDY